MTVTSPKPISSLRLSIGGDSKSQPDDQGQPENAAAYPVEQALVEARLFALTIGCLFC